MPSVIPVLTLTRPALALLEGIGGMEMALVAVIGLLLFGGKGLPDMARTFGKVMREFKKASSAVENEVRRAIEDEPQPPPVSPPREVARLTPPPAPVERTDRERGA